MRIIDFILLILIQVVCIFIFLCIFYFTYAASIEGEIVKNQVKFFIDDIFGNKLNTLPDNTKEILLNNLNALEDNTPEIQKANDDINTNNNDVKKYVYNTIYVASGILVSIIIFCYFLNIWAPSLNDNTPIHFKRIMIENITILAAVALTEYLFLTYISANRIFVKPNYLKAHIISKLNN